MVYTKIFQRCKGEITQLAHISHPESDDYPESIKPLLPIHRLQYSSTVITVITVYGMTTGGHRRGYRHIC